MFVKNLTEEQKAKLPDNAKGIAGLYIRWDEKTETGEGLALVYSWDNANKLTGIKDMSTPLTKIRMVIELMDYQDQPEKMILTIKTFKINNENELINLQSAGVNPLESIGLIK